jgi:hypothetical protein
MHASLPSLKYKPPSLMLYRHRVSLFAIQSLLYSFDSPTHLSLPCTSLALKCKCSAHPRLSAMITTLVIYQA